MLMEFFSEELKDIYYAEKHIAKTLPKLIKAANSSELQKAFTEHLEVTKTHVNRLEEVFSSINKKPQAKNATPLKESPKKAKALLRKQKKAQLRGMLD